MQVQVMGRFEFYSFDSRRHAERPRFHQRAEDLTAE